MGRTNAYDSYHLAEAYKQAIREGRYTTKELDEKVRRVLRLFYRTTMRREKPFGFLCSESHYDAALRIAQEGIVLLKNDRVAKAGGKKETAPLLPLDLSKMKRILVVGENAIKMMTVGGGSSSLKVQREILPLDAIQARCSKFKAQCSYARGYVGDTIQSYDGVTVGRSLYEARSAEELRTEAVVKAKEADVVIFFGGLNKSDYQDSEGHDRRQYGLPYGQDELLEALLAVNKDIVYVNISGNAVAMPWLDKVPAVVQGWFIGSEAGEALVSVLMGDVNPSGKLPFTWYQRLEDCGAHALNTYPGTWRDDHQVIDETYKEGVYVGYRWTDKQKVRPLFAFGHGLSYTTFKFGKLTADRQRLTADEQITFTVSVTNTGRRAGSETVQLYIADKKASVDRPVKELKAFQKVFLQPGETTDVKLTIGRDALSFYNEDTQAWKAEPGEFEALVGSASDRLPAKYIFRLE
jgi:beta-glucosidase